MQYTDIMNFTETVKGVINVKQKISPRMFTEFAKDISIVKNCVTTGKDTAVISLMNGRKLEIKLALSEYGYPKYIKEIIENYDSSLYCIILAPYITENTAKICENAGFGFLDLAGNCFISYDSIHMEVKGNKNGNLPKRGLKSVYERSSAVSSVLLRTMMEDVGKTWRIKELAGAAGCSIGQAAKVKAFLSEQSYIEQTKNGIYIAKPKSLMEDWAKVYSGGEEERVACYSLDGTAEIERRISAMKKDTGIDCLLTGFSGGSRYQPVVRYQKVHVLIEYEDLDRAIEYLGFKKVDTGANVVFIIKYNDCVSLNARVVNGSSVASPVQVYLDCMGIKGRGEEMPGAILDREICK